MKIKLLTAVIVAATVISCKTSNIAISESLSTNATVMDVKGNAGLLINQKISFGDYRTSPIKRGWTKSTELSVLGIKHTKAQQEIEFTQFSENNLTADIFGASNYNSNMFDLFKGLDKFISSFDNSFFAVIVPSNKRPIWKILVQNNASRSAVKSETDNGVAADDAGNKIQIKGTKTLAGNALFKDYTKTFGFELIRGGEAIAAVSVIGNGKVWMKNSLTSEDKLIVASIASVLIAKQNVSPTN